MRKKYSRLALILVLSILAALIVSTIVQAEPAKLPIPNINISVDGKEAKAQDYVSNIKLLIILSVLTLLPSIIIMMTSFVRIIVVLGFTRSALGSQQAPPNQVLIALAIFLTIFIMAPVYGKVNDTAIKPYLNNEINQSQAIEAGSKPIREFMLKQTRQKDLKLFLEAANINDVDKDTVPLYIVIPSFLISELKTAFIMGFLIYIPFLIIDLVVSSVLMSMGMFMLPPVMISLPFKLLLFVMVDGWNLLVKSLIMGFKM